MGIEVIGRTIARSAGVVDTGTFVNKVHDGEDSVAEFRQLCLEILLISVLMVIEPLICFFNGLINLVPLLVAQLVID